MAYKTAAERRQQRNRNLQAFHRAMLRLAGEGSTPRCQVVGVRGHKSGDPTPDPRTPTPDPINVAVFKRLWLMNRYNVEHSTDLVDRDLWDALDVANGKIPFRGRGSGVGGRGIGADEERPASGAAVARIYRNAKRIWGADFWGAMRGFIARQTRKAKTDPEQLTVREAQGLICALQGQSVKCGLGKRGQVSGVSNTDG